MRQGDGISKYVSAAFIPLCVWGLLCALLLYLIDLRAVFLEGGETRLRLATLAMAAGAVLVQRMSYEEGRDSASNYAIIFLFLISLFAIQNAYAYRVPVHPVIVFVVNEVLLLILWFAGRALTRAVSVDSESALAAAAERGSLSRIPVWKRRNLQRAKQAEKANPEKEAQREAKWGEKLPSGHPGTALLWFSLVALPLFGAGVFLLEGADPWASFRLGGYLFLYLWCAMSLLFLASLSQLRAYFEKREVSLPETIGVTWLGLGFSIVTIVMLAAYLIPQPASREGGFVRERIVSVYKGWESKKWGLAEKAATLGDKGAGKGTAVGKGGKPLEGTEGVYTSGGQEKAQAQETIRKIFEFVMRGLIAVGAIGLLVALYMIVYAVWGGLSDGIRAWLRVKAKKSAPAAARSAKGSPGSAAGFGLRGNPFEGANALSGAALVRYLWESTLAYCSDAGAPCPPDVTPAEFLESRPAPLRGFEASARFIADLFVFSQYSGQPLAGDERPKLERFWGDLQTHARSRDRSAA